jgi:hypothetical protein
LTKFVIVFKGGGKETKKRKRKREMKSAEAQSPPLVHGKSNLGKELREREG